MIESLLSQKVTGIKPSGIRRFFDIANELEDVISLGVGEPDFDTPWHVREEGIYSLQKGRTFYTANAGLKELRQEICRYIERKQGVTYNPMTEALVTIGGSEAIDLAMRALLNPGDEVIFCEPCYVSYLPCIVLSNGVPVRIPLKEENQFRLTPEELEAAITPKTKAIVLSFPNNPTGALYPKELLLDIIEIARQNDLIIFADEIYDRMVMDGHEHVSVASLAPDVFCVSMNGLSKSHRIAGFRIGWMVLSGPKTHVKGYIEGLNMLSNMRLCSNVLAQQVVQTSLGGHQSVDELLLPGGRIYEQRNFIYNAIQDIPGLSAVKPKAGLYIFPKIDRDMYRIDDDEQFVLNFLKQEKVLLVHGRGFNWQEPDHFRIVYLPRVDELAQIQEKMTRFLKQYRR